MYVYCTIIIILISSCVIIAIFLLYQGGRHASERGDDTVGNPNRAQVSQFELFELKFLNSAFRAQISQFELFELILLSKLYKKFPAERFEAIVSQPAVPSPLRTYSVA